MNTLHLNHFLCYHFFHQRFYLHACPCLLRCHYIYKRNHLLHIAPCYFLLHSATGSRHFQRFPHWNCHCHCLTKWLLHRRLHCFFVISSSEYHFRGLIDNFLLVPFRNLYKMTITRRQYCNFCPYSLAISSITYSGKRDWFKEVNFSSSGFFMSSSIDGALNNRYLL